MSTEMAQFEWPTGLVHDVGNSRVIQGRAVGMIVNGVPVIVITPDLASLKVHCPNMTLDPRTCPAVRLEITKLARPESPAKG